jgi:hypothetical protein
MRKHWTPAKVTVIVTMNEGSTTLQDVPGQTHPDYPGLAAVPASSYGDRSGWCVVHPPTGFLVFKQSTSLAKAKLVIERIFPLCDWSTGTADELRPKVDGPKLLAEIKAALGILE